MVILHSWHCLRQGVQERGVGLGSRGMVHRLELCQLLSCPELVNEEMPWEKVPNDNKTNVGQQKVMYSTTLRICSSHATELPLYRRLSHNILNIHVYRTLAYIQPLDSSHTTHTHTHNIKDIVQYVGRYPDFCKCVYMEIFCGTQKYHIKDK